jgi:hypothetical protein
MFLVHLHLEIQTKSQKSLISLVSVRLPAYNSSSTTGPIWTITAIVDRT